MKRYLIVYRDWATKRVKVHSFSSFLDAYRTYKRLIKEWDAWHITLECIPDGKTLAEWHIGCKHDKAFRRVIHA